MYDRYRYGYMWLTHHTPGMEPGRPGRNLLVGSAYLGGLAALAVVGTYYRPYRGC